LEAEKYNVKIISHDISNIEYHINNKLINIFFKYEGLSDDLYKDVLYIESYDEMLKRIGYIEYIVTKKTPYDILKNIHFPWNLAKIVLEHHERLDGSGYPNGLKGDSICEEARIIAIADVVEAISSDRPYRKSRGIDAALKEIKDNSGKLYDSRAVNACLQVFQEDHFEFSYV
jgi:hypothetical protein